MSTPDYDPTADRPTLRVFYAPKEKTPQKRHEDALEARVAELEALLSDREQELLEALDYVARLEDELLAGAP